MNQISRNQPCPCGSGKRYKHCCGADAAPGSPAPAEAVPLPLRGTAAAPGLRPDLPTLMQRALTRQKQGKLADAEALYREALALEPGNFDALHMLGVVRLQRDDPEDGARHILRAIRVAAAEHPSVWPNLALCLCAIGRRRGILDILNAPPEVGGDAPRIHFADELPVLAGELPLVSVLLAQVDDPAVLSPALQSLDRQGYRALERVTAPSLNAGAAAARGLFLAPLDADGEYEPDRLELMTRLLCATGCRWGISGVRIADAGGRILGFGEDPDADELMRRLDDIHAACSFPAAALQFNHALGAGNLLVAKDLWEELGGFRADSPAPVWDFVVRAALRTPPAILFEPKYIHRLPRERGTRTPATAELAGMRERWLGELRRIFADRPAAAERILAARHVREWRALSNGRGRDVDPRKLLALADELLSGQPAHA